MSHSYSFSTCMRVLKRLCIRCCVGLPFIPFCKHCEITVGLGLWAWQIHLRFPIWSCRRTPSTFIASIAAGVVILLRIRSFQKHRLWQLDLSPCHGAGIVVFNAIHATISRARRTHPVSSSHHRQLILEFCEFEVVCLKQSWCFLTGTNKQNE